MDRKPHDTPIPVKAVNLIQKIMHSLPNSGPERDAMATLVVITAACNHLVLCPLHDLKTGDHILLPQFMQFDGKAKLVPTEGVSGLDEGNSLQIDLLTTNTNQPEQVDFEYDDLVPEFIFRALTPEERENENSLLSDAIVCIINHCKKES